MNTAKNAAIEIIKCFDLDKIIGDRSEELETNSRAAYQELETSYRDATTEADLIKYMQTTSDIAALLAGDTSSCTLKVPIADYLDMVSVIDLSLADGVRKGVSINTNGWQVDYDIPLTIFEKEYVITGGILQKDVTISRV